MIIPITRTIVIKLKQPDFLSATVQCKNQVCIIREKICENKKIQVVLDKIIFKKMTFQPDEGWVFKFKIKFKAQDKK